MDVQKDVHCKPWWSYKLEYMLVLCLAALPNTVYYALHSCINVLVSLSTDIFKHV